MPRKVSVLPVSDFRGGVVYNADAFQLGDNQVTDALNVDFDPAGGFGRRDSVSRINSTALSSTPRNIWSFMSGDGTYKHIMAQRANEVSFSTGADFTACNDAVDALTTAGVMRAATANDVNYIQRNAENAPLKWTGAALTVVPTAHGAYNDNLANPIGGRMPLARYIARLRNYLFHAHINESGTQRRSRLRFSHPFSDIVATKGAEDYRTNDWIEVAPGDGDEITAIASWGEQLVIFKNNSTWVLRGYGPESFQLDNISTTIGAVSQEAVVVGDEGVYFFSHPQGLQLFDGRQINDLWYPLRPVTGNTGYGTTIDQLALDTTLSTSITVGYVNQRCWVSGPTSGSTTNNITFVYDPALGKGGGWTRYDLPLGSYTTFHPPSADRTWFAVYSAGGSSGRVLKLHASPGSGDTLATAEVAITSWCYTKWFDLGNPALVKRWKHPIFVVDGLDTQTLKVDVYRDYNWYNSVRSFDLDIVGPDTGMLWGTGVWGVDSWGGGATGVQTIEKGGLLGRGTAIALKVSGPAAGLLDWAVNSITFKYIPRRIRS